MIRQPAASTDVARAPADPRLISIVVPCHNEAENLPRLHEAVRPQLDATGTASEIVYVDDGSTDDTLWVIRELAGQDARVKYVALSRNFGKEAAMLAGLTAAAGDVVIIMDADLQHPPELIGPMIDRYRVGYDQVIGRRSRDGEPAPYRAAARIYYRLMRYLMDVEVIDGAGDFRLLSRRALDAVLELGETRRFSKGLFAWIGFDQAVIEYTNVGRASGRSKWGVGQLFDYGIDGLLSFNTKPLRAAIYTGLTVTMVAVGYMLWIIVAAITSGIKSPGYVTLLTAVIGVGGINMALVGVIGEYLGRVYQETKRRPHYLVKERGGDLVPPAVRPFTRPAAVSHRFVAQSTGGFARHSTTREQR